MSRILGIVNCDDNSLGNLGMLKYRSIGAVSFLGRYRLVDFPLSNMTNSGIEEIKVLVNNNPHSIIEHIGSGVQYNINSKRGKLDLLFPQEEYSSPLYNTDVQLMYQNLRHMSNKLIDYVVIAPSHILYSMNYKDVIENHIEKGADITVVYKNVNDADTQFDNCECLTLDENRKVTKIERNRGNRKIRNISLETYVMSRELFVNVIEAAVAESSIYRLKDIIEDLCEDHYVNAYQYKGYARCINSLTHYYKANMELRDYDTARLLIKRDWPIYTRTNDSVPTLYTKDAAVKGSVISNGCIIEGTVENSVIGRGVIIKKGAFIKDSVVMADSSIGQNVLLEKVVVDKDVVIKHAAEITGTEESPAYIKRGDQI